MYCWMRRIYMNYIDQRGIKKLHLLGWGERDHESLTMALCFTSLYSGFHPINSFPFILLFPWNRILSLFQVSHEYYAIQQLFYLLLAYTRHIKGATVYS